MACWPIVASRSHHQGAATTCGGATHSLVVRHVGGRPARANAAGAHRPRGPRFLPGDPTGYRPRPQFPQPVEPLVDLGHLDITVDFPPPLHHQTLREAYVLLSRLQLPPLQPLTPPPELPLCPPTPPPEQPLDWEGLEAAVAEFDAPWCFALPPPIVLQQPEVAPYPQFIPAYFAAPRPLPQVDRAMVAYALFTVAEHDNQQRLSRH